jgi:hypothetical protein
MNTRWVATPMQLLLDAATAGTAVAKAYIDAFEQNNRSPSPAEIER